MLAPIFDPLAWNALWRVIPMPHSLSIQEHPMKAALCKSLDGPDAVVIEEIADPVPGPTPVTTASGFMDRSCVASGPRLEGDRGHQGSLQGLRSSSWVQASRGWRCSIQYCSAMWSGFSTPSWSFSA